MLIDKIKADRIAFMKSKEKDKARYLSTLLGEIDTEAKRGQELTDALVIQKIKKTIKGLDETLKLQPKALSCLHEKAILNVYLPQMMSKETIQEEISLLLKDKPNVNIGDVMKYFKNLHDGTYEPKLVKETLDEIQN